MIVPISVTSVVLSLMLAFATVSTARQRSGRESPMASKITITIGDSGFAATLADNATAAAFTKRLPLSLTMAELNGNEKFVRLPADLPTDATTPRSIHTGDLMLYGSDTLVLFYKSFPTKYSYTRVARVDAPAGLEAALRSENVRVTFAVGNRESRQEGRSR